MTPLTPAFRRPVSRIVVLAAAVFLAFPGTAAFAQEQDRTRVTATGVFGGGADPSVPGLPSFPAFGSIGPTTDGLGLRDPSPIRIDPVGDGAVSMMERLGGLEGDDRAGPAREGVSSTFFIRRLGAGTTGFGAALAPLPAPVDTWTGQVPAGPAPEDDETYGIVGTIGNGAGDDAGTDTSPVTAWTGTVQGTLSQP